MLAVVSRYLHSFQEVQFHVQQVVSEIESIYIA